MQYAIAVDTICEGLGDPLSVANLGPYPSATNVERPISFLGLLLMSTRTHTLFKGQSSIEVNCVLQP